MLAQNLGLGGGGAMFCPVISPDDPTLMFVSCDMTGLYRSTDGGQNWVLLDGRLVQGSSRFSVAFDPSRAGHVIAYHPAQGLKESTDGGVNWTPFSPALPQFYDTAQTDSLIVTAAAFSPEASPRLLIGTTKGVYQINALNQWQRVLTGTDQQVVVPTDVDPTGKLIVNTADVITFVFVTDPTSSQFTAFVATDTDIFQWNPQTSVWNPMGPANPTRPVGPFEAVLDRNVTPPKYIASRVRGFAGSNDATNTRYVLYMTILTDRSDIMTDGGVYRYEKTATATPSWQRVMQNGINISTGDQGGNTDAPRYEHLAVAQKEPDSVYVTVVNNMYTPNVYKGTLVGGQITWNGVYYWTQSNMNLSFGWLDQPPPSQPPVGRPLRAVGLGWGFGGAAKGFTVDPKNSNTAVFTNLGAVHITRNGGTSWQYAYTKPVPGTGTNPSPGWTTIGLDVTTTWHYVIHPDPAKATIHFICYTDIGLARSQDAGTSWVSISQSDVDPSNPNMNKRGTAWNTFYELAFGPSGVIWAAVSTQHDIPHETQLGTVKQGGVLQSGDDGQTWHRIGYDPAHPATPNQLPNKPVVSLVYAPLAQAKLYASVWGDGVYESGDQGQTWSRLVNSPGPSVYRLQFDEGSQTLYCLVSGRGNGSGLYAYSLMNTSWTDLTAQGSPDLRASVGGAQKLYPIDFTYRQVQSGTDLYICTASTPGGPDGQAWKFNSGTTTWIDLHVPFPATYHGSVQAFAPFFIDDLIFVTSTSHGIWCARRDDVEHAPPLTPNWVEYPAMNFLGVHRLEQAQDASLYITTFGSEVWRVLRQCSFILDRSTFSKQEIDAGTSSFPNAFYLVYDGVVPMDFGITDPNAPVASFAPKIILRQPDGTIIPDTVLQATPTALLLEYPSMLNVLQRFTFTYQVQFTGNTIFSPIAVGSEVLITATASKGAFLCMAQLTLVNQGNAYMLDGPIPWLSEDLRVFQFKVGDAPRFGATLNGGTRADAQSFLATVLHNLNDSTTLQATRDAMFEAIATDEQASVLELSRMVQGRAVFNCAIARVHYLAQSGVNANGVQVFFRLCSTQVTGLDYNPDTAYRRFPLSGAPSIALLGLQGGAIATIPSFAAPRVDTTQVAMTTQTDPLNTQTIAGMGIDNHTYYGCWLDFNQTDPQFASPPPATAPDGQYTGTRASIFDLIRDQHQCLVAEIFQWPDIVSRGDTPATSDKLAQRNLCIVASDNPGSRATHTVQHTFEIHAPGGNRGLDVEFAGEGSVQAEVSLYDELLIRWGNLPRTTRATLYLPSIDVNDVLTINETRAGGGPKRLVRIDAHTVACLVSDITYVPIPDGRTRNIPALLTLELPDTVRYDESFRVLVQQASGNPRQIVGSFEWYIPVVKASELLLPEERRLAVLRYIQQSIPPDDPWFAVFQRHLSQIADRVKGFGGNPDAIPASPDGAPQDRHGRGCLPTLFDQVRSLLIQQRKRQLLLLLVVVAATFLLRKWFQERK